MKPIAFLCMCYLPLLAWFPANAGEKKTEAKRVEKTSSKDLIVISVSMPKESLAGSAVNLDVRIQNHSKVDIGYIAKGKYWDYYLSLCDSGGKPVPPTQFGKMVQGRARTEGSALGGTLETGKELTETLNVARVFDLSQEDRYTLKVSFKVTKGDKAIDVTVGQITFKIVEESR